MQGNEMINKKLPVPVYRLAMLQAYLYETFGTKKHCNEDFHYTEWYLSEFYNKEEINKIIEFFRNSGIRCDCGILKKIDLRELGGKEIIIHE